jgi:N-methylhydantoinase A/oxoprolinase/acetone carboxylase beta subunit
MLLGIDTGGTYTDAVLFDPTEGVKASAKALTTRQDLAMGIREAMDEALSAVPAGTFVELVCLSTTLATNAIVEGQGSSICLILIGYTPDMLEQVNLREALGADPVVLVRGGHDAAGDEAAPLDREAALQAIRRHAGHVAAFAVSGYFSVRNPAHENAVRRLVREQCGLPVTCGHELTSNLHASRRALTTALNARLIPLLGELIGSVKAMLAERGIRSPLMVVKGDGSLIDSELALEYPVETILSGPAASVVGSLFLSGETDACVADMGGTTSDIALVSAGRLLLAREGARVGGWQTMVEAVQIHTTGLGGDSAVNLEEGGRLTLGPRRSVPLALLGHLHPELLELLNGQAAKPKPSRHDGRFLIRQRPADPTRGDFSEVQRAILSKVGEGPLALERVFTAGESSYLADLELRRLVERGYLGLAGFTPTDAAHLLGYQTAWSVEAARAGAAILARRAGIEPEELCRRVVRQVTLQAGRAILSAALAEAHGLDLSEHERVRSELVDRALLANGRPDGLVSVRLTLNRPLVAIGAPVSTYYPAVADALHTRLAIPAHAEVANAVGAVVGSVMQSVCVLVAPLGEEREASDGAAPSGYRVHLSEEVRDFAALEPALQFARQEASAQAEALASRAGAASVQVTLAQVDHCVEVSGDQLFLGSEVTATATGRPRLQAH